MPGRSRPIAESDAPACLIAVVLSCTLAWGANAFAQPGAAAFQESVSLNTDSTVVKRLATLKDYIAEARWNEALTLLRDISDAHPDALVSLQPGRYVNAANYCDRVLAGLPPAGLAAYRAKVDPQARQWFEQGRDNNDGALLRKVVEQAFASSFADDALRLLGDRAWEHNSLSLARAYWEQMLPPDEPPPPGGPLDPLRYPDTDHHLAEIRARLVLCSLLERDFDRARRDLQTFSEQYPDAGGTLAGRTGNLADTLAAVLDEAQQWEFGTGDPAVQTFALNPQRNGIVPAEVDVGAPAWVISLPEDQFPRAEVRPALREPGPLSYYPVVLGKMLLLNDADRIYAFHLETGRPWYDDIALPGGEGAATAQNAASLRRAILYRSAVDSPVPVQPSVGVPAYTLTLHEGRIYARMGSPVTGPAARELRDLQSDLICFDPLLDQGKLLWRVGSADVGEGFRFEGSPVVYDGRVYVVLRRRHPQTQLNVACFDADAGRLQWNRDVCAAVGDLREGQNRVSHLLLTLAEDTLFLSTDVGAIAALEAGDGQIRWVAAYESRRPQDAESSDDAPQQGLVPCLYHRGTVMAAPNDFPYVVAFDAQDGQLRWRTWLPDRIRHLLGVGQDRVIASGDRLWGLNVETGALEWNSADHAGDPEAAGYGRGLLVADKVYWPKRGAIEIRDQRTGRTVDLVDLSFRGSRGGNLLIAGEYLVISEADRLIGFGQESGPIARPRQVVDSRPLGARVDGHTLRRR